MTLEVALGRLNVKKKKKKNCIWEVTFLPQDESISHLVIPQKYFSCIFRNLQWSRHEPFSYSYVHTVMVYSEEQYEIIYVLVLPVHVFL